VLSDELARHLRIVLLESFGESTQVARSREDSSMAALSSIVETDKNTKLSKKMQNLSLSLFLFRQIAFVTRLV
jgi:hypothetical protein